MANNYFTKKKEELLEEVSKRPELNIDAADMTRDELAKVLTEDDLKKNPPPPSKDKLEGWGAEEFDLNDSIIAPGYSGKIGTLEISINPGERKKKMKTSGGSSFFLVPGEITINKKPVNKVTGLTKEAVWTLVHAKVITLNKEQSKKFASEFYKK